VAIKLIRNLQQSSYGARKILREITLLRKLSECEENIFTVQLLDLILPQAFRAENGQISEAAKRDVTQDLSKLDHIFLVMTLVEQDFKQLFDSISQVNLTDDHIKVIIYNSLCALKFIHKAGIIHRDIKPSNILIDSKCQVVLCDFGLSRTLPSSMKPLESL
jgi:mitogen-activated protein kinase 1/3